MTTNDVTAAASVDRPDTERPALASVSASVSTAASSSGPTGQLDDMAGGEILPNRITSMPRLGRGLVWADVLAEIERDNVGREAA